MPMPPHPPAGSGSKPCSANSVSTSLVVSTSINWVSTWLSLQWQNLRVTLSSDSSRKMAFGCLWCRSRVRAHFKLSGAEEPLGLSQHIFLFKMHQSSSSYLHCKLKSMKILSDLSLNKTSFLDIAYMKLTEWKRKARKAQAFPQLIYFQWLARMVIPRTGQLWQKCSIKSKFSTNSLLLPVLWCPFDHGR